MNEELRDIPNRILQLASAALSQANMHAAFIAPGNEHWPLMSVLNTAHAGELFLKAIIATEHPLLIFKDLLNLDDNQSDELNLKTLLTRGRTHDFERLPKILWTTTGIRVPNPDCYERLRSARNAIQHFCPPEEHDLGRLSLEFIYTIIDPLIYDRFGIYAIHYHEDYSIGYDYLVATLLRQQLRFSILPDFDLTEICIAEQLENTSHEYREWFAEALNVIDKDGLLR
jgi:hypothetical protein